MLRDLSPYARASSASCAPPPRSEPVAEAQELRLVDRRQDHDHRHLDDLVLDGDNAERPFSAVGLRDHHPPRRQRPIRSPMQARVQVAEPRLPLLLVVRPRLLVDARGRVLVEREERTPQNIDAEVVEERRQSLRSVPVYGSSYAGLRL